MNKDFDDIELPTDVVTVAGLIDHMASLDEGFALATQKRSLIRAAVDEELVDHDFDIRNAKIVALFPPMTGG